MGSTIFREKSLKKIASPEQMNDYIRVSSPSVWMVLTAVIVLLAGVCVWGMFGHLDTAVQTGGVCADGRLTVLVGQIDPYVVHLAGFTEGDWVYRLYADVPGLADGVYAASVITERVRPLDFVLN